MIESPLIQDIVAHTRQEVMAEYTQKAILRILAIRLGSVPEEIARAVKDIVAQAVLDPLLESAIVCPDFKSFQDQLPLSSSGA